MDTDRIHRRTLGLLFVTQVIAGVGASVGASVGALLAAEIAGVARSGMALSASVVGAALFAVPAAAIVDRWGRRPSLALGYGLAAIGALLVVAAASRIAVPLLFAGLFLFGCSSAASYQARYAAVDLAPDAVRGRHLSLVVWATTLGAVVGPSLAAPAGAALARQGVPTLAGPYVLSAGLFGLAAVVLLLLLRPDPAVAARVLAAARAPAEAAAIPSARVAAGGAARVGTGAAGGSTETMAPADPSAPPPRRGVRAALPVVLARPAARLGVGAMAIGHVVMVGVMTMTPVHIRSAGHDATHTLRIVGFVLSAHVAGMYAFAPGFGWLTDRMGRRPVVMLSLGLLLAACALAGTAAHDTVRLTAGMLLLGLGWSGSMVAGSTLLSEAVPAELRPSAQGLSDLTMGLAGATAGALSGVVVEGAGYAILTLLAALATMPLVVLLLRPVASAAAREA